MTETPISIIIPAFNQLEYCRQCIFALRANTARPYRLILVDNGSTDGVAGFFDSVSGAVVVHAGENKGFAGGVNLGLEYAQGHVLLLNSDTLAPRGWLRRLEAALLHDDHIGMVGPMSNCVSGSQQIDGLEFDSLDAINGYADRLAAEKAGQLRDVARLVGFCLLIRDSVVEEVGGFDESYETGNFEDDDYCLRVLRTGRRLCVAEDAFVFHYGSRTFMGMGVVDAAWEELLARNQRVFEEKWRARPEERSDAAQQSRRLNREGRAALETGGLEHAIRLLTHAVETAPFYHQNYNDLGAVLWQAGEGARACRLFKKALSLAPGNAEARENLLNAAEALGQAADAREFLMELDKKGMP